MSLASKAQQFDSKRAQIAAGWLASNLKSPPFAMAVELAADLQANLENHVHWLTKEPSACKAVEYFAYDVFRAEQSRCPLNDPPLVSNASSLLCLLLIGYERAGAGDATLSRLEAAHEATLRCYLELSSAQIDALCGYLRQVRDFLGSLRLSNTRLVLVDMPVGNTLIVCLLEQLLSPLCRVEMMRVALQRNTSRSRGPTRQGLLEEKLAELALAPNEIVLYFDEWSTGANFNAMCEIQRKRITEGAFFLPIAALTQKSANFDRYASFCDAHSKLIQKWGRNGAEFRRVLPPVSSVSRTEGYFFWSEKDRMAGVRKLQVHGAMFSSIDATIEYLCANEDALNIALGFQLADFVTDGLLPERHAKNIGALRELFYEGCADYRICRDELRNCANDTADAATDDGVSGELERLSPKYAALLNGRKAKIAVITAFHYSKRFGSLDPENRYYFETHAPVVDTLSGRMAEVHRVTLTFLKEKLRP